MESDVYDLYERQMRDEMSLGEYDESIVQWYLHGESVVETYISAVSFNYSTRELIPAL